MKERIMVATALILGLVMVVNATWQLVAPQGWYWAIPGVPDRGPFNQHFVRDLGIIYALSGAGLIMGALRPQQRFGYWWAPTVWLVVHALLHLWEVLAGISDHHSLIEDFAGVTLPALTALVLLLFARRNHVSY